MGRTAVIRQALIPEQPMMLIGAFAAAYGIGFLAMLALPFLVGAVMDSLGLSAAQAGMLGTAEFVGVMIAALAVAPRIGRIPRRTLAQAGAVIAIIGNAACALVDNYGLLVAIRFVIGLATGLALASGNATISNARDPERMAGQMAFLFVVLMIFTTYLFGYLVPRWGHAGAYAAMAGVMSVMLPCLHGLPQRPTGVGDGMARPTGKSNAIFTAAGLLTLLGSFLFAWRDMMQWSFVERIGVLAGYSVAQVGEMLSLQAFVGLAGPLLAMLLGSRLGLRLPVLFGLIVTGTVTFLVMSSAHDRNLYALSVMGVAASYFFALSYLTAMAAELDRDGRVVAAQGSLMIGGAAVAPVTTGYLIDADGYGLIRIVVVLIVALTLLTIGAALWRFTSSVHASPE